MENTEKRWSVRLGYIGGHDEWEKFTSDSMQEAVEFCKNYPNQWTNYERVDAYIYVCDSRADEDCSIDPCAEADTWITIPGRGHCVEMEDGDNDEL